MTAAVTKYRDCADAGLTMSETARRLGVCRQVVSRMARNHGITFAQYKRSEAATAAHKRARAIRLGNPAFSASPEAVARALAAHEATNG